MGDLLTVSSNLACPHGGVISVKPAQTQDTVDGQPILTVADTFIVGGCPFTIGPDPSPCSSVHWIDTCSTSTAGGYAALSSDSIGLCNTATGAAQGPVMIISTR